MSSTWDGFLFVLNCHFSPRNSIADQSTCVDVALRAAVLVARDSAHTAARAQGADEWQLCLPQEGARREVCPQDCTSVAFFGSRLDSAQLQLAQNYLGPNYNNLVTAQREESLIKHDGLDAAAGTGSS